MSYPPVAAGLLHAALFDELDAGDTPPVSASQLSQVPPLRAPGGQVGIPAHGAKKTTAGEDQCGRRLPFSPSIHRPAARR